MNQILYTDDKNNGAMEIKKIVKIFVIGIILFGVICVGEGSYGIVHVAEQRKSRIVDPYVTIKQEEEYLILNIEHNTAIDKIIYKWNDEPEVTLQGKGRKNITEEIVIPNGENTFNVKIVDNKNHEVSFTNTYVSEIKDKIEPEIEFLIEDGKIKIVAKDETALDYISYYWNDEDATTLQAREESPKTIEEKITILKGENTLTVVAVDEAGNEATKEQTYIGAKKPTIETFKENNYLIIKVNDEQNIQKIEYTYNGEYFTTDKENTGEALNMKQAYCKQEIVEGTKTIVIKAYNVNGLVTEETLEVSL